MDALDALLCKGGTYITVPCRGPRGCAPLGHSGDIECDDDLANLGDNCMSYVDEDYACSTDRSKALVCKEGKFQLWGNCRGPKACQIRSNTVDCDRTLQEADDPCTIPNNYACSVDQKFMLICHDGRMVADNSCRGPKGCVHNEHEHRVDCDDTIALEGDPCSDQDEVCCSQDGKSRLICKNHKYVVEKPCRRREGCSWVNKEGQPRCEW